MGRQIDEETFKDILSGTIIFCLIILAWSEWYPNAIKYLQRPAFGWFMGVLGGFSTMIANISSPIMAIYLLSMQFSKTRFIVSIP